MNDTKFCTNCGTENLATSLFCKECGAKLDVVPFEEVVLEEAHSTAVVEPSPDHIDDVIVQPAIIEPIVAPTVTTENYIPLSDEDVQAYMGDSSQRLFKKYKKHCSGKSTFNWSVFFLSILGIPFVWFFYRKMKKVGTIVLAIWFALIIGSSCFAYLSYNSASAPVMSFVESSLDIVEDEFRVASGIAKSNNNNKTIEREFNKMLDNFLNDPSTFILFAISVLFSIAQIVFIFILPFKANKLYFKKLDNDIRKSKFRDSAATDLRSVGGVNINAALCTGFLLGFLVKLIAIAPVVLFSAQFSFDLFEAVQRSLSNMGIIIKW